MFEVVPGGISAVHHSLRRSVGELARSALLALVGLILVTTGSAWAQNFIASADKTSVGAGEVVTFSIQSNLGFDLGSYDYVNNVPDVNFIIPANTTSTFQKAFAPGTYTVYFGLSAFGPAYVSNSVVITVTAAPRTLDLSASSNPSLYSSGTQLNATASAGGGTASYSVTAGTAGCSVDASGFVTATGAGTCQASATIASDGTYADASATSITLTFTAQAAQTIAFNASTSAAYKDTASLTGSATSGLSVAFSSLTPAVCSVSGTSVSFDAIGTCTIAADQAGDANWLAAPQVTQNVTVGKGVQTIGFTGPASGAVSGSATLSATATSGLAVSFSSTTTGVCTVSGNNVTYVTAGTCTIAADQAGDANWLAAPQVTQNVTVGKGVQTIGFTGPASGAVSGSALLSATATSGLAVSFSSTTTGVCTVSGNNVTYVAAGTCTIAADQSGDANWNAATQVTQSIAVGVGTQTITFAGLVPGAVGGTASLSATATSGLAVSFSSSTAAVCTVAGNKVTYVTAGTCTIAADQAGNANWSPAPQVTQNVTVGKGVQTITFTAPASGVVGGSATLSATATSGLAVTFASTTTGVCTVSGNNVTYVTAGSCTIAADQAGGPDWRAAARVTRTIAVGAAATTTSLTADKTVAAPGAPVLLTAKVARASGSVALTGTVSFKDGSATLGTVGLTNGVATWRVSSFAVGSHTIVAVYSGDSNYTTSTSSPVTIGSSRPNPAADPTVRALVANQFNTMQRIASGQIADIGRRLDALHEDDVPAFVNGLSAGSTSSALGYSATDPMPFDSQGRRPAAVAALDGTVQPGAGPKASAGRRPSAPDYNVWTAGTIGTEVVENDGIPNKTRGTSQSATLGIDTRVSSSLKAGIAISGYSSSTRLDGAGSKSNATAWTGSLYGSFNAGQGVFIDGLVGFGDARLQSKRVQTFATGLLTGTRQGTMVFGSLALSLDQRSGALKYSPYTRIDVSQSWLGSYSEAGDPDYALAYDKASVSSQSVAVGLRGQYDLPSGTTVFSPTLRLEYAHAFGGAASQTLRYLADPSTGYGVSVDALRRDTMTGALGLKVKGQGSVSGQVEYSASFDARSGAFAGQGLRGAVNVGF